MKPGSITLKKRQKINGMASSRLSEVVVKATALARKVMATVFLDAEFVILVDIILHDKLVTQTCPFKHMKPCRSISGEFNLKSSIMTTPACLKPQEAITKLGWTVLPSLNLWSLRRFRP
jgi:hypothetical protein